MFTHLPLHLHQDLLACLLLLHKLDFHLPLHLHRDLLPSLQLLNLVDNHLTLHLHQDLLPSPQLLKKVDIPPCNCIVAWPGPSQVMRVFALPAPLPSSLSSSPPRASLVSASSSTSEPPAANRELTSVKQLARRDGPWDVIRPEYYVMMSDSENEDI